MSNISDERLVVAAVKGESKALDELIERAIFGKHGIRTVLKRNQFTCEEMKRFELHILELVFNKFYDYEFSGSFETDGFRFATLLVSMYKENSEVRLFDKADLKEKALPDTTMALNNAPIIPKHPPLDEIDIEIRTLVSLLNQSSNIKRITSCSGHPSNEESKRQQYGGYLRLKPIGSLRKTLDFLVGLLMRLDNTILLHDNTILASTPQIDQTTRQGNITSIKSIRERYIHVDAETLFFLVPLLLS